MNKCLLSDNYSDCNNFFRVLDTSLRTDSTPMSREHFRVKCKKQNKKRINKLAVINYNITIT